MGFKNTEPIEPESPFDFAMKQGIEAGQRIRLLPVQKELMRMLEAEKVTVIVVAKEDGLEEKRAMYERVVQRVVDDHIKVFGFHAEMLRPGITKLGFDNEFECELLPVQCSHHRTQLVNNGNDVFHTVCRDCKKKM